MSWQIRPFGRFGSYFEDKSARPYEYFAVICSHLLRCIGSTGLMSPASPSTHFITNNKSQNFLKNSKNEFWVFFFTNLVGRMSARNALENDPNCTKASILLPKNDIFVWRNECYIWVSVWFISRYWISSIWNRLSCLWVHIALTVHMLCELIKRLVDHVY